MTPSEFVQRLEELGIPEDGYQALFLLPLVEVAWADRQIDAGERRKILDIARDQGLLTGGAEALLMGWLEQRPLRRYFVRGRRLFADLVRHDVDEDFTADRRDDTIALCLEIAQATGGIFGVGAVCDQEKKVLAAIKKTLGAAN